MAQRSVDGNRESGNPIERRWFQFCYLFGVHVPCTGLTLFGRVLYSEYETSVVFVGRCLRASQLARWFFQAAVRLGRESTRIARRLINSHRRIRLWSARAKSRRDVAAGGLYRVGSAATKSRGVVRDGRSTETWVYTLFDVGLPGLRLRPIRLWWIWLRFGLCRSGWFLRSARRPSRFYGAFVYPVLESVLLPVRGDGELSGEDGLVSRTVASLPSNTWCRAPTDREVAIRRFEPTASRDPRPSRCRLAFRVRRKTAARVRRAARSRRMMR